MISEKKYFLIPYGAVPVRPTFKIWSSTWSEERPVLEPSSTNTLLVGYTDGTLPEGATLLLISSKDPPPPPPPPTATANQDFSSYQQDFEDWFADAGRQLKAL